MPYKLLFSGALNNPALNLHTKYEILNTKYQIPNIKYQIETIEPRDALQTKPCSQQSHHLHPFHAILSKV